MMNREIKFMAYSSENNSLIEFDLGEEINWGYYEDVYRYSGMKDKNGNEIYEGHITKGGHYLINEDVVIYEDGAFWLSGMLLRYFISLNPYATNLEIIGHIATHKNLIE